MFSCFFALYSLYLAFWACKHIKVSCTTNARELRSQRTLHIGKRMKKLLIFALKMVKVSINAHPVVFVVIHSTLIWKSINLV